MLTRTLLLTLCVVIGLSQAAAAKGYLATRAVKLPNLVGGMEIKANSIYELAFEDEAEAEIYFVQIKPGRHEMSARGLEQRGVVIKFIVE
jgi:hypothetical protein